MNSEQHKNNKQEKHSFDFSVEGPLKEFVHLKLFDGRGEMIANEYGNINKMLDKGLYQLQIFSNEKFEEKLFSVTDNIHETWKNQGSYSSVPLPFLESSRHYYSNAVAEWKEKTTDTKLKVEENDASLLFFFRYPSQTIKGKQKKVAKSMGWRFSLLDKNRNLVLRFSDENCVEKPEEGWLALHKKLNTGIYYLVYKGNTNRREIPVYVYPRWQSQFYMTFKRTPIFETARIQLVRQNDNFSSNDYEADLTLDNILSNLNNGIYHIPEDLITRIAYEKWDNPILAIAVCYAYLLSPQENNNDLFKTIIRNIRKKILSDGNSSDLMALKLLASIHFNDNIDYIELKQPCMFNIGMKVFIDQSIKNPDKVKISEECEEIIANLRSDTVITSYLPINKKGENIEYSNLYVLNETPLKMIAEEDAVYEKPPVLPENEPPLDWLSQSISNQLIIESDNEFTLEDLAKQFQVSQPMVAHSLQNIYDSINFQENILGAGNLPTDTEILKNNINQIFPDESSNTF